MEWVETTAKTVQEARDAALDQLGVAGDDAEFDVLEEPRPGLFGRVRGQARVRARVKPTPVRPKQERRRKGRDRAKPARSSSSSDGGTATATKPRKGNGAGGDAPDGPSADETSADTSTGSDGTSTPTATSTRNSSRNNTGTSTTTSREPSRSRGGNRSRREEQPMSNDDQTESTVTPEEVGEAAVAFMSGLTDAFGYDASTELHMDGIELQVDVSGSELGLLVGPGGRTLNAIQDLARVAAQRRLGDHDTRLRIDVAGYRERRNAALAKFALEVAESVRTSGSPRSLEPMSSADRKVIHDVLNDQEGVASRSEGEDPNRRIVVVPA